MPVLTYPDFGAAVYLDGLPDGLAAEPEELYSSLFSTLDYIAAYDPVAPTGAVTLEDPRHVLLFGQADAGTVEVLTRRAAIPPEDLRRACRALFRALPAVHRIHCEVLFPPRELRGLAKRSLYSADDMVITLPESVPGYLDAIGRSTRRNLRTYENRFRRAFPGATTTIEPVGDRVDELFDRFVTWKRARMAAVGDVVYFDRLPHRVQPFLELLRRRGEVHLTSVNGRLLVLVFTIPAGRTYVIAHYAYDPELDYYHLGLLSQYWAIGDAVARGMKWVSLEWGNMTYKARLGGEPVRGTNISVFRSEIDRLRTLDEEWEVVSRRVREEGGALYWRARHAVGGRLRAAGLRGERAAGGTAAGEGGAAQE